MGTYDLTKSLFLQALELPGSDREAFVLAQTEGLAEARSEVLSLLRAHDRLAEDLAHEGARSVPQEVAGYVVQGVLGRGGMGLVLLAARPGEPAVALKLLREGWLSPDLLARFRRESEALRRLDHPGIARFVATGVDSSSGTERPWLAMERVEGATLREWAAQPHSLEDRLELMARVCDAVQHAHEHGIVHRDLKPENILVRPDGQPVVLDFGVARLAESDVRATTLMTSVGVLVGTIRYMSPEQADARAEGIGPRSDVHALGVLTCELLTGRLPFEVPEDSVHRALVAVMTHPPRPMPELPGRVRAPLQRVLEAALAKDPADRTAAAAELAADLRRVREGRRPLARPRRPVSRSAALPLPVWLALGSGGLLLGVLLSASRQPPTLLDWVQGALQPRQQFVRIRSDIDSAFTWLHLNTRTTRGLEKGLAFTVHAGALLRTVAREPWQPQVLAVQRFREGEARYLLAERAYDPAGFERAAALWLESTEPVTARRVALPDTVGVLASVLDSPPVLGHGAAAMALEDRGRLIERAAMFERAAKLRSEGAARQFPGLRDLADSLPGADALALAHWRAGNGANEVERAVQQWSGEPAALPGFEHGLELLESAAAEPRTREDGSSRASILHALGVARLWAAAMGDSARLAPAREALTEARTIRSQMPGYSSVVHSACALAEVERFTAWRAAEAGEVSESRAALQRAIAALDVLESEDVRLMPVDRAILELTRAAVLVDRGCVDTDSSRFTAAWELLDSISGRLDDRRAPRLALIGMLLRFRIECQRAAIAPAPVYEVRLRSLHDQMTLLNRRSGDLRLSRLFDVAHGRMRRGQPVPYALGYPQRSPF